VRARAVGGEAVRVEPEVGAVGLQVVVPEGLLAVEEEVVHRPEALLPAGGLGRERGVQGMGWIWVSGKCRKARRRGIPRRSTPSIVR
jgi:hypothetical protein